MYRGEDLALLRLQVGQGQENREGTSSIRSFWLLETSFHAFIWMCVLFHNVFWFLTLPLHCQMAKEIIIIIIIIIIIV